MKRRLIFSQKMHVGYQFLSLHVRPDADGRMIGRDARGLLHRCLNGNGRYVYDTFKESRTGAITVFPVRAGTGEQFFQLHEIDYEVRKRRPPGRCNTLAARNRLASSRLLQWSDDPIPSDPIGLDFYELTKPSDRPLLQYLIHFQGVVPSVALEMVREGLERLQRINAAGWQITMENGYPKRRLLDPHDSSDFKC